MLSIIKQIKEKVENSLVAELKALFGEEAPVMCDYDGEVLSANIRQSSSNVVISTTFVRTEDDFYYNCVAFLKVMEDDEVVGVVPQGCQINFTTFAAAKEAFDKVISGVENESKDSDVEAAAAADEKVVEVEAQ